MNEWMNEWMNEVPRLVFRTKHTQTSIDSATKEVIS